MTRNSEYAGIDYSLGRSNVDRETGIHYGVISQHSISGDALNDLEPEYGDPTCGECSNKAIESSDPSIADAEWNSGKDYACAACERVFWSEDAYPDEPQGFKYDRDGYKLSQCLDTDIFVLKAPFYTYAQFCSPCVPGAGNLDTPCEDGPKTYCLGHDWFEDGKAPYTVYSVETGEIVNAAQE